MWIQIVVKMNIQQISWNFRLWFKYFRHKQATTIALQKVIHCEKAKNEKFRLIDIN